MMQNLNQKAPSQHNSTFKFPNPPKHSTKKTMLVKKRTDLKYVWEDFVLHHKKVLVVYHKDVDAICAKVSMITLLKRAQKEYVEVPMIDIADVQETLNNTSITAVIFLNGIFSQGPRTVQFLTDIIPPRISAVYVFDAFSVDKENDVFLEKSKRKTKDKKENREDSFVFYMPFGTEAHSSGSKDFYDGRWDVCLSCAHMILHLSQEAFVGDIHDRYMVWRAIVATTYYFLNDMMETKAYGDRIQDFRDECSVLLRLDEKEAKPETMQDDGDGSVLPNRLPVAPNRMGEIRCAVHYRLVLPRYCPLWTCLSYSPLTATRWNEKERKEVLAQMGISLQSARQTSADALSFPLLTPKKSKSILEMNDRDVYKDPVDAFCLALDAFLHRQTVLVQVQRDPFEYREDICKEGKEKFTREATLSIQRQTMFYQSFSMYRTPNAEVDAADLVYLMDAVLWMVKEGKNPDDDHNDGISLATQLISGTISSERAWKAVVKRVILVYQSMTDKADSLIQSHRNDDHQTNKRSADSVKTHIFRMTEPKQHYYSLLMKLLLDRVYVCGKAQHDHRIIVCVEYSVDEGRYESRYDIIHQHSYPVHLIRSKGSFGAIPLKGVVEFDDLASSTFIYPQQRHCFIMPDQSHKQHHAFLQLFRHRDAR